MDEHTNAPRDRSDQESREDVDPDAASAGGEQAEQPASKPMSRGRKLLLILVALVVVAALVVGGTLYWLDARRFESTDDAFIDGHISQIAPQIGGQVTRLAVDDNQVVRAGQLLLQIDPRATQVRLDQVRAQQAQGRAQLANALARVAVQQATIAQQAANARASAATLTQAQQDLRRDRAVDPRAISRQSLDSAHAQATSAVARRDADQQAVAAATAELDADRTQVDAARATLAGNDAAVADAQLQLSYATIVAPTAGRVTKRTVELGNTVNIGQALLSIVPDGMWVTANFKETQLARMQPGQPVRVRVDAIPDRVFDGHVDSFQAGSGAAFSTLPAENATGNYVKVVQRVPVKIDLDHALDPRLSPGLSASPRVQVRP